jgi:hypothetical protein
MLNSIANQIAASGLTEASVKASKKQPNLATMIDDLGFDRLVYIAAQKIGSHHVHGTWSSLLFHYLEERGDTGAFLFGAKGDRNDTHINQYMFVPVMVLNALKGLAGHSLDHDGAAVLYNIFDSTEEEIMRVYTEVGEKPPTVRRR